MKYMYIIAGPNGAGKTTAAQVLVPDVFHIKEFVNADEIAKGLSPFNAEAQAMEAGRTMLRRIDHLIEIDQSFAFETTLASRSFVTTIKRAQHKGYIVQLLFLWLPDAQMAKRRVAKRVAEGGHAIPEDVIVRRYAKGSINLRSLYIPLVDSWRVYDHSGFDRELIAQGNGDCQVIDAAKWQHIMDIPPA